MACHSLLLQTDITQNCLSNKSITEKGREGDIKASLQNFLIHCPQRNEYDIAKKMMLNKQKNDFYLLLPTLFFNLDQSSMIKELTTITRLQSSQVF